MLQAVNWRDKLNKILGGHRGRVLRILILFLCALGVLVGVYRARSVRLEKEKLRREKPLLKIHAATLLPAASTAKWVIVGNPDEDESNQFRNGADYVCSVASVAREAGWKSVIIGPKLDCCIMPDCYPINRTQFLRMNYRTAHVLKNLTDTGTHPQSYKEAVRNIAFLWVIHRGARWVFDAYVEEYQSSNVTIPRFEEELARQLHTLALDESLALVQERGRTRGGLFRNPYSHFGRPDVRLVPNSRGAGSITNDETSSSHGGVHHAPFQHYTSTMNLAHGHTSPNSINLMNSHKYQDFPTFRICEVRPPHIEKFLEIDEGWWDLRAPALVLPGDTMPPLCTRNTLFSPEVFWALPLLPDYSRDDFEEHAVENAMDDGKNMSHKASRIPPWYIRGLWSQSLLGDLGGSIRLTLSRVPTLQMNKDYFAGGDYEQDPGPNKNMSSSAVQGNSHSTNSNRTGSSKLLKRWHCRSRSTFRCLLLMSKELSKSIYLKKFDLKLIEAWIVDLKNIHYMEPPMLPRRRSHANPCLGADGLHGVSFYPSLEPRKDFRVEEFISKRNETFKGLEVRFSHEEQELAHQRQKRETDGRLDIESSTAPFKEPQIAGLLPPKENSTYVPNDWSDYLATHDRGNVGNGHSGREESSYAIRPEDSRTLGPYETYYRRYKQDSHPHLDTATSQQPITDGHSRLDYYQQGILSDHGDYHRRGFPVVDKSPFLSDPRTAFLSASRSAKHLHEALAKHHESSVDGFPILKAMAETMCTGFGDLIPYQPATIHSDVLLIIAFTNHHYDLIPTLEVLYRSSFPNMLYCGNPHESVELFLRKYQSVEHRSFSFLPTYTRATYECVLGAMEMNYEVKGYIVITDETLIKTWNIDGIDKTKLWVSSSSDHENRHVPVTKESWPKLDPRGQKLPRLIDGLANTWKMLTYFLVGQDAYIVEPATIKKKRSVPDADAVVPVPTVLREVIEKATKSMIEKEEAATTEASNSTAPIPDSHGNNDSQDKYETQETSYVPVDVNRRVNRIGELARSNEGVRTLNDSITHDSKPEESRSEMTMPSSHDREGKSGQWDLTVSDWNGDGNEKNYANAAFGNIPMPELDEGHEGSNETYTGDDTTDDVEVGEEEDEPSSSDVSDDSGTETVPLPDPENPTNEEENSEQNPDPELFIVRPTSEPSVAENSTDLIEDSVISNDGNSTIEGDGGAESVVQSNPVPTTPTPVESSVGVPLYHVEHVEPPTPPTYHKPEEKLGGDVENKDVYNVTLPTASNISVPEVPKISEDIIHKPTEIQEPEEGELSPISKLPLKPDHTTEINLKPEVDHPSTTTTSTSPAPPLAVSGGGGSEEVIIHDGDTELKREMEVLLDGLKKVYLNLVGVVQEYQEMNDTSTDKNIHEIGSDGKEKPILEDSKSHRISPREFRHIRCTMQDDGHQSELCFILRDYVNTLLLNLGVNIHLYHDTIPMYYLPSSATKPFYSVANVLLHHGVMDELALPLLFRGLAPESEWIKLVRSTSLSSSPPTSTSSSSSSAPLSSSTAGSGGDSTRSSSIPSVIREDDYVLSEKSQYLHPFHLHKVYSDESIRKQFCKNYLLKLFEM